MNRIERALSAIYSELMQTAVEFKIDSIAIYDNELPETIAFHAYTYGLSDGTQVSTSDPSLDCEESANGGILSHVDLYLIL